MEQLGINRKLAAILNADVKDYSRLMRDNEAPPVRALTAGAELPDHRSPASTSARMRSMVAVGNAWR